MDSPDWSLQRDLIRLLVKRVEVDHDEINVVFRVAPHRHRYRPAPREVGVGKIVGGVTAHLLAYPLITSGADSAGSVQISSRCWRGLSRRSGRSSSTHTARTTRPRRNRAAARQVR